MTKRQVMVVFFFKQKTAYEMRISDWSSDVCSSDLPQVAREGGLPCPILHGLCTYGFAGRALMAGLCGSRADRITRLDCRFTAPVYPGDELRSEEHTSELQSLMRISYAVFCLKKKIHQPDTKL